MELWRSLPCPYTESLRETRKVLLACVATRWASTKDEIEANTLRDFLFRTIEARVGESPHAKLVYTAIRGAAEWAPPDRVANVFLYASRECQWPQCFDPSALLRALKLGWALNRKEQEFGSDLDVVAPLLHVTIGAHDLMERMSKRLAKLDASVQELTRSLLVNRHESEILHIVDGIEIEYLGFDQIVFRVRFYDWVEARQDLVSTCESVFHLIGQKAKQWQENCPGIATVEVKGVIAM